MEESLVRNILVKMLSSAVMMILISTSADAHLFRLNHAPYVKINDNFHLGFTCIVADGSAQLALKLLLAGLTIPSLLMPGLKELENELIKQGADKITLKKGDAYCFWMHVTQLSEDQQEDGFERRDVFVDNIARYTTSYQMEIYNEAKNISSKSGKCEDHRHCWTGVVPGTDKATAASVGFAACLEPQLANGQKVSVVIVQGNVPEPLKQTPGKPDNKGCEDRKAEFYKKP
jgi:hypothetical protein